MRLIPAMVGAVVAGVAPASAQACQATVWTPDRAYESQRSMAGTADSIYLARAVPDARRPYMSTYHRIVTLTGDPAPRTVSSWPSDCNETDTGLQIVYAYRLQPRHAPFRPWEWGSWQIASYDPDEIVDPGIVWLLRRAAARLRQEAQQ